MQSGAAGDLLVVIAHVVVLVCTTKKPGPLAVSDTYMPLKCRQTDRRQSRNQGTQITAHASRNTSLADIKRK